MSTRGVAILGSTGSIGTTALRVLARQRERFHVAALTAFANAALLEEQAAQTRAPYVGLVSPEGGVGSWARGASCLVEASTRDDVDIVLNAVVGSAGLDATLAALGAGKRVALANKETLVMGGELVARAARAGGGELVPVDSEHSAILQCLAGRSGGDVRRLVITASGGPFRDWSRERIERATVDDALQHPTWRMGRKITIDSATLANKALEVIATPVRGGLITTTSAGSVAARCSSTFPTTTVDGAASREAASAAASRSSSIAVTRAPAAAKRTAVSPVPAYASTTTRGA